VPRFSKDTLPKIGISLSVVERLVEMLNWTGHKDEQINFFFFFWFETEMATAKFSSPKLDKERNLLFPSKTYVAMIKFYELI
jgi:hypothetical protein